jgi:hypothetical protein
MKEKLNIVLGLCIFLSLVCVNPALAKEMDYSIFENLLKKYVSAGQVDYLTWKKKDLTTLTKFIKNLEIFSLQNLSINERKAFWINAYNALAIYAVVKYIPNNRFLASVFSVRMVPGFFNKKEYVVAGQLLTLDDIENKKLRAEFGDARIHFAIVCASRSCPPIYNTIFRASNLDQRLNKQAQAFIRDKRRNHLNKEKNILYLSQIFKWFAEDFIQDSGSVEDYLKKYLWPEDVQYLFTHQVKIKYLYYDWLVNIRR